MSLLQNVSPEQLVELVHHYQEALAGDLDCAATKESIAPWERTRQNERKLRIAAIAWRSWNWKLHPHRMVQIENTMRNRVKRSGVASGFRN